MFNTRTDIEAMPRPTDGISDMSFSPQSDFINVTCWDGKAFIWEVLQSGSTIAKTSLSMDGSALCCAWSMVQCFELGWNENFCWWLR